MSAPTNITNNEKTEAEEIAKIVRAGNVHSVEKITSAEDPSLEAAVAFVQGHPNEPTKLLDLEAILDARRLVPRRKKGRAALSTLDAFLAYVARHKTPETVVFAKAEPPELLAQFNPHGPEGKPAGWADFGATLKLEHSEAFERWAAVSGEDMSQADFASLVEDRIADLAEPSTAFEGAREIATRIGCEYASPSKMMATSRGLTIRANQTVKNHVNLSTGETELAFVETHAGEDGTPIKVPGAFLITIPVFEGGAHYQIAVRVRYRAARGAIAWKLDVYRMDLAIEHAIGEVLAKVRASDLTVFEGSPG